MPTYDYQCEKCGHQFEVFQSMNDERLTDCPQENCDGRVKRLIGTGAGIIFKGSGFYETDYRSDSYKKAASADKAPETSSDSKKSDSTKSGSSKSGGAKSDSGGGSSGSSSSPPKTTGTST